MSPVFRRRCGRQVRGPNVEQHAGSPERGKPTNCGFDDGNDEYSDFFGIPNFGGQLARTTQFIYHLQHEARN